MIAFNGPSLSDTAAMSAIIQEAIDHWIKKMKRCLNRSNLGRAGRPKKTAPTMKLSDLLFAQSRDAERPVSAGPPICEEADFELERVSRRGRRHHRAAPGGGGPVRTTRRLRGLHPPKTYGPYYDGSEVVARVFSNSHTETRTTRRDARFF